MNFVEAGMFVAVGFVPTLIALELVYRMGRAIGKRGEISSLHKIMIAENISHKNSKG
jgi:hypothetical protein